jgi:hypothetical protein
MMLELALGYTRQVDEHDYLMQFACWEMNSPERTKIRYMENPSVS